MSGTFFQVWWHADSNSPERASFFDLIEADFQTFDDFVLALAEDRMIRCRLLVTHRTDDRSARFISARREFAFAGSAVSRTMVPTYRLQEVEK